MDNKTRAETREYNRGYHDGRSGKDYNDGSDALAQIVTLGLARGPRDDSGTYGKGYSDGKRDR